LRAVSFASPPCSFDDRDAPAGPSLWSALTRITLLTLGFLLLAVGLVGALLPGHLGVPLLVIGLIMVLRTSRPARRRFIHLQRRHPKIVFPIRRLLRREPELMPVCWQQVLRTERMLLPQRWRYARVVRRRLMRSRRPSPADAAADGGFALLPAE
jgi:hypothetical protein